MERKTASNWLARSLSGRSKPTRVLKTIFTPHRFNEIEFAAQHGLGQTILRNGETKHAARFIALFEDGDVVPEHGEIERGGKACGPCTGDCNFAAGRRKSARSECAPPWVRITVRLIHLVGDEAMHLAHVHDFIERLAAASVVARMLADAAGGCGQRVVEHDGFERVFEAAFLEEFKEARNVHAQRATVFAGRQRKLLADSGAAAMGEDVVLVLFAEVADSGEHRIGRGLAEAAERTFADHAAKFVEQCQDAPSFRRPLVIALRMRSALFEPDSARHALCRRIRNV